jgi:hypothetical protein
MALVTYEPVVSLEYRGVCWTSRGTVATVASDDNGEEGRAFLALVRNLGYTIYSTNRAKLEFYREWHIPSEPVYAVYRRQLRCRSCGYLTLAQCLRTPGYRCQQCKQELLHGIAENFDQILMFQGKECSIGQLPGGKKRFVIMQGI